MLLADARSIVTGVDLLKARAKGMAVGLEPELSKRNVWAGLKRLRTLGDETELRRLLVKCQIVGANERRLTRSTPHYLATAGVNAPWCPAS